MDSNATLSVEGPSPVHLSPCRSPIRRRVSHPSGHFQNATFPELKPTLGICLHQGFITVEALLAPRGGQGPRPLPAAAAAPAALLVSRPPAFNYP